MRRFPLLILLASSFAFGQGAYYQNVATSANYINGTHVVTVIDGAQIQICTSVTSPCTPVTVYSDQALTQPITPPVAIDNYGNFSFWVSPGSYAYWISDKHGIFLVAYPFSAGGGGGSGGTLAGDVTGPATSNTVVKVNGAAVPPSTTVLGTNSSSRIVAATTQGNGAKVQLAAGTTTTGHLPVYDSSGNLIDSGNGPASGVISLNSLTGALNITAGSNITVTPTGSSIRIDGSPGFSPLTTKGDLFGYSVSNARLPVGPDGDVLTADSTQALGIKWGPGGSGSLPTATAAGQAPLSSGPGTTYTAQPLAGTSSAIIDANSLVYGNVSDQQWNVEFGSTNGVAAWANDGSDGTYSDLTYLNYNGAAIGNGLRSFRFIAPPGATTATFSVPAELPPGVSSSTIVIQISSSSGTDIVHAAESLTSTLTNYTVTASVVPGTEYGVTIYTNATFLGTSAQAQALIGRVSVTAAGATGIFGSDYFRIQPGSYLQWDDANDVVQPRYVQTSDNSRFVFDTTASSMTLEFSTTVLADSPQWATMSIYVNGRYYQTLTATVNNLSEFQTVTLPAGQKRVEIVTGIQDNPSTPTVNILGTWLKAVYFPQIATVRVLPPPIATRRLVIYGDSICSGAHATVPEAESWPTLLRVRFQGSVATDCWGSRSLYEDYNPTSDPWQLAYRLARYHPTDVWIAIGVNDWGHAFVPVATFQNEYAQMLDAIHQVLPNAKIWVQTPIVTVSTSPNSRGDTLADYRTAIANVAQSERKSFANFIDGTTILTTANLYSDGVHPNQEGHAIYSEFAYNTLLTDASPNNGYVDGAVQTYDAVSPGLIPLRLRAGASQTADLLDVNDSSNAKHLWVDANYNMAISNLTSGSGVGVDSLIQYAPNISGTSFIENHHAWGSTLTPGNSSSFGFAFVGNNNACNSAFMAMYANWGTISAANNGNFGVNVPLGTCPTSMLEVDGTFSAGSARQFQVDGSGNTSITPTATATSSANVNSPNLTWSGSVYNGSGHIPDTWTCFDDLSQWTGSPTNAQSILTCNHAGSSGGGIFKVPSLSAANINTVNLVAFGNPGDYVLGVASANTATSGANFSSPHSYISGAIWGGSFNVVDRYDWQNVIPSTGTNPNTVLTLAVSGSTGTHSVDLSAANGGVKVASLNSTGVVNASSFSATGAPVTAANQFALTFGGGIGNLVAFGTNPSTVGAVFLTGVSSDKSVADQYLECIHGTSCAFADTVTAPSGTFSGIVTDQIQRGNDTNVTIQAQTGAGSGATTTCVSGSNCTASSGTFKVTTGTSTTTGAFVTFEALDFAAAFMNCSVTMSFDNSTQHMYAVSLTEGFTVTSPVAPAASGNVYTFTYVCGI